MGNFSKQNTTLILVLLGLTLLLILGVALFLNYRSEQKLQQITQQSQAISEKIKAEAAARKSPYSYPNSSQEDAYYQSQAQPGHSVSSDAMDSNIKKFSKYNREIASLSEQLAIISYKANRLFQQAYDQDQAGIHTAIEKLIQLYNKAKDLPTPQCMQDNKNRFLNHIADQIDQLNQQLDNPVSSLPQIETNDKGSYDCWSDMP